MLRLLLLFFVFAAIARGEDEISPSTLFAVACILEVSAHDIYRAPRGAHSNSETDSCIGLFLMWSDPDAERDGFLTSPRGAGYVSLPSSLRCIQVFLVLLA